MKKNIMFVTLLLLFTLLLTACNASYQNSFVGSGKDSNNSAHIDQDNKTEYKVVIDPGHGGTDVGATGTSGQYEKSFTLSLSQKVANLLKQESSIQVFMTRNDDSFISQESRYRPKFANEKHADLFLSIHGNTFSNPDVSGTETFYYHKHSRLLAEIIQKHVVEATGFRDRGIKKEDLFVVKDTEMPAALIEVGYLTNQKDESKMLTEAFQDHVATSIVEGIKEYLVESEGS